MSLEFLKEKVQINKDKDYKKRLQKYLKKID